MKITTEKLPRSQVLLNIEVEPEVMEQTLQRAYRRIVNSANIPGFRKGKAPRPIVERYFGHGVLVDEALDILFPEVYAKALEEEQIQPVAQPQVDIVQKEPPVFKATVSVRPTVELGDVSSLHFTLEEPEITDEQIDREIENLRRRYAEWETVDRPVQEGDLLSLDVESTVGDGEAFINDQGVSYMVAPALAFPVAGFPEQLVGMVKDEPKEFTLTVQEDYPQPEFRNKTVTFKVTVRQVQERKLPELTDEVVPRFEHGVDTVAALREHLREELTEQARAQARFKVETEALDALVAQSRVEYPEVLVEHEMDHLVNQLLPQGNQARLDAYLQAIGRSRDELRNSRREEAEKRVVRSIVLEELAKRQGIEVTEDEVTNEALGLLRSATSEQEVNTLLQGLSSPSVRDELRHRALMRKTMAWLVATVTGGATEPGATASDAAEAGAAGEQAPTHQAAPSAEQPS